MFPLDVYLVARHDDAEYSVKRELGNLNISIELEVESITECYSLPHSSESKTKLFVVEITSHEDISWLAKLNDKFSGFPILAIVHVDQDPNLLVSAMRAGASQVVKLPLDSKDFQEAIQRIATQFGHAPELSETIAVLGSMEGVGATSLSINLAAQIARKTEMTSLLIEGNTVHGHLATYLDLKPKLSLYELLSDPEEMTLERLQQALISVEPNFRAIVGPHDKIYEFEASMDKILEGFQLVRNLSNVTIIDMSGKMDSVFFDFLQLVDQIILVGEQRISSIAGIKVMLDKLAERHIHGRKICVVSQYDDKYKDLRIESIRKILEGREILTIRRQDELFRKAENEGRTLHQISRYSRVHQDFDRLIDVVLQQEPAVKKRSFFSRLFGGK